MGSENATNQGQNNSQQPQSNQEVYDVNYTQKPQQGPNYGQQYQQGPEYYQRVENYPPQQRPQGQQGQKPPVLGDKAKKKFNLKEFVNKKWWLILLVLVAIATLVIGLFAYFNRPQVENPVYDDVVATIKAPKSSPLGSPATWEITIQNREEVAISNVELKLAFDKEFKYNRKLIADPSDSSGSLYNFGSIAANSQEVVKLEGILTGNIDETTIMKGLLNYTPEPYLHMANSRVEVAVTGVETKVATPEIEVEMIPTQTTVEDGSEMEMKITFENLSDREINNLKAKITYPDDDNFEYASSELILSRSVEPITEPDDGNDTWYIDTMPKAQNQTLNIKGKINGTAGVKQSFIFEISVRDSSGNWQTLVQTARDITVTAQAVSLSTYIKNKDTIKTFSPDEDLEVIIEYKNESSQTLQNIEIYSSISDPAQILDWTTLEYLDGNEGNVTAREIHWRGSGAPQLLNVQPKSSGKLRYKISTKQSSQFLNTSLPQTSYTLQPHARVEITNKKPIEVVSDDIYKARGDLIFNQQITLMESSDTERVYKVRWIISVFQNSVDNISVVSGTNLPSDAWSSASIQPSVFLDNISYDSGTGRIRFTLDSIGSYTGFNSASTEVSFLLTVNPIGSSYEDIELLKSTTITGTDNFTGEKYEKIVEIVELED